MDELKPIITYHTQEYGFIRVKLRQALDSRGITRNRLRTLTGVKYDVIDRYYKNDTVQMVDLDFLAKVCCVLGWALKIFWNMNLRNKRHALVVFRSLTACQGRSMI